MMSRYSKKTNRCNRTVTNAIALATVILAFNARAALQMPSIFSDHMVLQSGKPAACWGWADAGARVKVSVTDSGGKCLGEVKSLAGESEGRWEVRLPILPAMAAAKLSISTDRGDQKAIADILVGEVWLASGQSNMTRSVGNADFPKEVMEVARQEAAAINGSIRIFTVAQTGSDTPQRDVAGKWIVVTPETVDRCSAIAWNFAHALNGALKTPVGMVVSGFGGTPVESWIPLDGLNATEASALVWKRHRELLAKLPEEKAKYDVRLAEWEAANPTPEMRAKNAGQRPGLPYSETDSRAPVRLFNAMIYGLAPFQVQGVLWYQGEENSSRPQEYPELIQALITSWRKRWGSELPFFYVELSTVRPVQQKPSEGGWAFIREAQQAALKQPHTAVVTAVDVGNGQVHPWNKKPIGERLAAVALSDVYGKNIPSRSPEFASCTISDRSVRLKFKHADGLRTRGDGPVAGFAISENGTEWKWAQARIVGDEIEVSHSDVASPVAVRYGWADNPVLSVENQYGLPLRPFRTDAGSQ